MKLAFSLAILATFLVPQQAPDPTRELRAALGGDAALKAVERLQVKAKFTGDRRGKGESETFVRLPDRFIEKSHGVVRRTEPSERYPRLTAGMGGISLEETDTQSEVGLIGDEPLFIDMRMGKSDDERHASNLRTARFAFARLMIPLFGGASTVTSAFQTTGALVFQDVDQTTWTLTLDAASRPATLTSERQRIETGATRYTTAKTPLTTFSDFRPVSGGLVWPHHIVTTVDGRIYDDVQIKSYEINGKVPKVLVK